MDSETEEQLLRSVALQNAQSILHARQRAEQELLRTRDALEDETRILEVLNEIGGKLASNLDLKSVVQMVTDAATELTGASFGAFCFSVKSGEANVFALYALSGMPGDAFEQFGQARLTPIRSPAFRSDGILRLGDVRSDARYSSNALDQRMPPGRSPMRSYLTAPVIARSGELLGGLFFGHEDSDVFSERSERLLAGIAAQAAIAIDNSRLYEEARRAGEERERLLEAERAARQELERVAILKDEFLATLSHELRTPLNAVLGWSSLLLSKMEEGSEYRRAFEAIARNARAQARLVEDLLDMNGIIAGRLRLDVQWLDLGRTVNAALETLRPSAEGKSITVRKLIDPNAGPISGDPNRLQQVAWNLLNNAVKFTPKGGEIDVIVQRSGSHVELIVHDSGIGIAPAFMPYVFERFRQADASSTREFGGVGIGLSIARQLVELHGGTIQVSSEGTGMGTTFTVQLPVRAVGDLARLPRAEELPDPNAGPALLSISLSGTKAVVVEDDPDARELVSYVLQSAGAEVFAASSAFEGLAFVQTHRPDVIVSDIGMPERDGYQFMGDVRRLSIAEGGKTPAIALTAFARSEDRTRAMLAGYQGHMAKPIEPQELVATVKSLATGGKA